MRLTAEQLADELAAQHRKTFAADPRGEIEAAFYAELPDNSFRLFSCPWRNDAEKRAMLDIVAKAFQRAGVVRYAVWMEVWMTVGPPRPITTPTNDPNRIEAVNTLVIDPTLPQPVERTQRIIRGSDGAVLRLELLPQKAGERAIFVGRIVELLGPPTIQ